MNCVIILLITFIIGLSFTGAQNPTPPTVPGTFSIPSSYIVNDPPTQSTLGSVYLDLIQSPTTAQINVQNMDTTGISLRLIASSVPGEYIPSNTSVVVSPGNTGSLLLWTGEACFAVQNAANSTQQKRYCVVDMYPSELTNYTWTMASGLSESNTGPELWFFGTFVFNFINRLDTTQQYSIRYIDNRFTSFIQCNWQQMGYQTLGFMYTYSLQTLGTNPLPAFFYTQLVNITHYQPGAINPYNVISPSSNDPIYISTFSYFNSFTILNPQHLGYITPGDTIQFNGRFSTDSQYDSYACVFQGSEGTTNISTSSTSFQCTVPSTITGSTLSVSLTQYCEPSLCKVSGGSYQVNNPNGGSTLTFDIWSDNNKNNNNNPNNQSAIIIGCSVGGSVAFLIVCFILYKYCWKPRSTQHLLEAGKVILTH